MNAVADHLLAVNPAFEDIRDSAEQATGQVPE